MSPQCAEKMENSSKMLQRFLLFNFSRVEDASAAEISPYPSGLVRG
jgi:hypothetical protein